MDWLPIAVISIFVVVGCGFFAIFALMVVSCCRKEGSHKVCKPKPGGFPRQYYEDGGGAGSSDPVPVLIFPHGGSHPPHAVSNCDFVVIVDGANNENGMCSQSEVVHGGGGSHGGGGESSVGCTSGGDSFSGGGCDSSFSGGCDSGGGGCDSGGGGCDTGGGGCD